MENRKRAGAYDEASASSADIVFSYTDSAGIEVQAYADTIMDFIDTMDGTASAGGIMVSCCGSCEYNDGSCKRALPSLTDTNVKARFFQNKFNKKEFNTIAELLAHCKEIIK